MEERGVPGSKLLDRALLVGEGGGALLAADLHLGLDLELERRGVSVPPQSGRLLRSLLALARAERPERVVLLGDVRHAIPLPTRGEEDRVPAFLAALGRAAPVTVVPGNHDAWLSRLAPEGVELAPARGIRLGELGLFHGHAWPGPEALGAPTLVCGHCHPSVTLTDSGGHPYRLPCWATAELDRGVLGERFPSATVRARRVVVMPAFNPLITGRSLNDGSAPMGPLLRSGAALPGTLEYTLLDGTHLGRVPPPAGSGGRRGE